MSDVNGNEQLHVAGAESTSSVAPIPRTPMHPLLTDENAKDVILRFHQQRGFLKRAVESAAEQRVYLPPMLVEALECILTDTIPPPSHAGGAGRMSPTRPKSSMDLNDSVSQTATTRNKQELSTLLRERCAASPVTALDSTAATELSTNSHIDLSQHAILHHPTHAATILREQAQRTQDEEMLASGTVPPPRTQAHMDSKAPRQLMDAAFDARRSGNRRLEIEILVDYVHRGREGRVPLDTAATLRLLRQIGDAHSSLKEFVSAEQYYFDWYLIAEKVGDQMEAAKALTALGNSCLARGDLKAAEQWLSQAQWRAAKR